MLEIAKFALTITRTTNSDIRSVKLFGSWDNFTSPYSMDRDRRKGPGNWIGCFHFTDIMADGPHDQAQWRADGLKMGSTYYYYYVLNEDVKSYNDTEQFTTKCPLLPGEPLNILNVPIVLPNNRTHGRSSSNGSQGDEYRKLEPEDKFMNPRRPPKPDLGRLQTATLNPRQVSPSRTLDPSPVGIHRSISQPNSAGPRNPSTKDGRSVSPPRARGLRSALSQRRAGPSPRARAFSEAQNQENQRQQLIQQQRMIQQQQMEQRQQEENAMAERRNIPGILVHASSVRAPTNPIEDSSATSIQARRAFKANAGNAAPPVNLLSVDTRARHRQPSASKNEVLPAQIANSKSSNDSNAPSGETSSGSGGMSTPTGPDIQHKRLPSLPNSPSSVMDEAVRAIDERDKALDAQIMRSHFSSSTIDNSVNSRIEQSRFSEWSTDTGETDERTTASMVSTSTFNHQQEESPAPEEWTTPDLSSNDAATNTDPNTPRLTANSKPSSPNSATADINPWNGNLPEFAVSLSSPSLSTTGLGIEQMDEVESNPKRHAALFNALESMQDLSLAQSRSASPILLPGSERNTGERHSRRSDASAITRGKATMQELMDELAHLKNMMESGTMNGEPF